MAVSHHCTVFAGFSGFLHYLQLASHELATIGINVTKNKIPNSTTARVRIPALVRTKVASDLQLGLDSRRIPHFPQTPTID